MYRYWACLRLTIPAQPHRSPGTLPDGLAVVPSLHLGCFPFGSGNILAFDTASTADIVVHHPGGTSISVRSTIYRSIISLSCLRVHADYRCVTMSLRFVLRHRSELLPQSLCRSSTSGALIRFVGSDAVILSINRHSVALPIDFSVFKSRVSVILPLFQPSKQIRSFVEKSAPISETNFESRPV
jgi:hypothetical protein